MESSSQSIDSGVSEVPHHAGGSAVGDASPGRFPIQRVDVARWYQKREVITCLPRSMMTGRELSRRLSRRSS